MKKNRNGVFIGPAFGVVLLLFVAFLMSSCYFESDDDGLKSWLSDQGMPSSYKMQTLSIENIKATSAEVFLDTAPILADDCGSIGHISNLTHDLVLDIAFESKSTFLENFSDFDSSRSQIILYWQRDFYKAKNFPEDSIKFNDDVEMTVSWKFESSEDKKFFKEVANITDSAWFSSLSSWDDAATVDTVVTIAHKSKSDTAIVLGLPSALTDTLRKMKKYTRLQMRLSMPKAPREYRFYGPATNYSPILVMYADSALVFAPTIFRMARIVKNEEECAECPVLHGGVFDSLVVELPSEPILEALSEFYGDEFPYTKGDSNDVRQTVVLAQLTMARDDSKGSSEFGLPIQVVVGSYLDSADTMVRRMENYRLNNEVILESGHQNLVFHDGDSLTVQLTAGLRNFINNASDGRNVKFMMRLGRPFLQEKDTTYANYLTADGDTSYVFMNYFDYARYDFSTAVDNPMTLKLWLASKRGDEE